MNSDLMGTVDLGTVFFLTENMEKDSLLSNRLKRNFMVKKFQRNFRVLALTFLALSCRVFSQSDYQIPMSGWPADIQTAWQIQGEYYGVKTQDTTKHLGAWLIARGGANYDLVLLPGGLITIPGQQFGGWNGTTRYQGQFGPAGGSLNGKVYNVGVSNGFQADSITGTGEARNLFVHNMDGSNYVMHRVSRKSPTRGLSASKIKTLAGGDKVVPLWDSSTGNADLAKWSNAGSGNPQIKYTYLYRGIQTVANFGTGLYHIEFLSCFNPTAGGQNRANSGFYLEWNYEMQVLDSYGLSGAENEFGGIYSESEPKVNAALPPQVTLQTYDVYFVKPGDVAHGGDAGKAKITVYCNGVLVQDGFLAPSTTPGNNSAFDTKVGGPIYLQDHGNEVVFNNIWVVPDVTTTTLPYASVIAGSVTALTPYRNAASFHKENSQPGTFGRFSLTGRNFSSIPNSTQPTFIFNQLRK